MLYTYHYVILAPLFKYFNILFKNWQYPWISHLKSNFSVAGNLLNSTSLFSPLGHLNYIFILFRRFGVSVCVCACVFWGGSLSSLSHHFYFWAFWELLLKNLIVECHCVFTAWSIHQNRSIQSIQFVDLYSWCTKIRNVNFLQTITRWF